MYVDLANYFYTVRRALREPHDSRRRKLVWSIALLYPIVAAIDFVCFALDHLLFPGFRRIQVRRPIFIVGGARSGTTHTHRLMAADGERFSYFKTWEILLPSIVQKKLIHAIGALDRRVLGGSLEARLQGRQDRALGKARRMHDWRLDGAEEDGFLGLHSFGSGTLSVIFPYNRAYEPISDLDGHASAKQRKRTLDFYESCVKRQLYVDGPDKRLLSKNPGFMNWMSSLRERFPDCQFVFPARNPLETTPSLLNMLEKGWRALGCDPVDIEDALRWLEHQQLASFRHAFDVMDELPEGDSVVVPFAEIVSEPRAAIDKIYTKLGMDISPEYARWLDSEQEKSRSYTSQHRYDPRSLGVPVADIRAMLGPIFERCGWQLPSE